MDEIYAEEWRLLFDNINAFTKTQALMTACDVGLFEILADNNGLSIDEISIKLNISQYATRVLLICTCNTGLIYRDKETKKYYNSSAAEKMLNPKSKHSMLGYINFNYKIQMPTMLHFTESVRSNSSKGLETFEGNGTTLYERLSNYPELEMIFQNGLSAYSFWLSSRLLKISEFSKSRSVLEIAGGDATTAILLSDKFLFEKFNILEIPTVCNVANQKIKQLNLSQKIECTPCNVFVDQWPQGYDTILISHFIEIFSEEKVKFLYKKISNYLYSSGTFILWTPNANENEDKGLQAAKSSMYFLTTAGANGFTYTVDEHIQWLTQSGLEIEKIYNFEEIEHTAIVARKK